MNTKQSHILIGVLSGIAIGGLVFNAIPLTTVHPVDDSQKFARSIEQQNETLITQIESLQDTLIHQGNELSDRLRQIEDEQELLTRASMQTPEPDRPSRDSEIFIDKPYERSPTITVEQRHDERLQALFTRLQDPFHREELTMSNMAIEVSELPVEYQREVSARINELLRSGDLSIESLSRLE